MAVQNTIPMLVDLYKNNNTASKTYGQYYGRVFPRDGLNLKGFARHLSEHGKLASYEMLVLVLQNIVDCMRHLLLEGVPIKLEGLGTFRSGIEGTGSDSIEDYRTDVNIKGIRINFMPEGAGDEADNQSLSCSWQYDEPSKQCVQTRSLGRPIDSIKSSIVANFTLVNPNRRAISFTIF